MRARPVGLGRLPHLRQAQRQSRVCQPMSSLLMKAVAWLPRRVAKRVVRKRMRAMLEMQAMLEMRAMLEMQARARALLRRRWSRAALPRRYQVDRQS